MINKYNEHEGAHKNVGGHYNLKKPMLEEESHALLSHNMEGKPFPTELRKMKLKLNDMDKEGRDAHKRPEHRRRNLLMDDGNFRRSIQNGLFAPSPKKDVQSFVNS